VEQDVQDILVCQLDATLQKGTVITSALKKIKVIRRNKDAK